MKWLILYILKGQHERLLNKYHDLNYVAGKGVVQKQWNRVVKCRNRIRRIEPNFLKVFD